MLTPGLMMMADELAHMPAELVQELLREVERRRLAGSSPTAYAAGVVGGSPLGSVNQSARASTDPMPANLAPTEEALFHTFETGAKRSERYEERLDLIPREPLRRLGRRFYLGAIVKEYGEWNWQKGLPLDDTFNHTIDHLYAWIDDVRNGKQTDPDHLAGAMWGCAVLMYFEKQYKEEAFAKLRQRTQEAVKLAAANAERELKTSERLKDVKPQGPAPFLETRERR